MAKRRPRTTTVGGIKPLGMTRAPVRQPRPSYRPFRVSTRRPVKPPGIDRGEFVEHRRGPSRPNVGADPREAMAVQNVKGSLPERIFYKKNLSYGFTPDIDFDFQTSQEGGRLELGGMVADFLYWKWRMIVRVQGPTHSEPRQRSIDSEQFRRMSDMGYQVYDIDEAVVYDPIRLDRWFQQKILWNPGKNGRTVVSGNTLYQPEAGVQFQLSAPMNFAMSTDEKAWVSDLDQRVANLESTIERIGGKQIVVVGGISDISENLGLIHAGEFRVGNNKAPGQGFIGVRIGYPAFTYDSASWHIAGVNADVLQFGLSALDGKAYFGAGSAVLGSNGLKLTNTTPAVLDEQATIEWVSPDGKVLGSVGAWRSGSYASMEIFANANPAGQGQVTDGGLDLVAKSNGATNDWETWVSLFAVGDASSEELTYSLVVGKGATWNYVMEVFSDFSTATPTSRIELGGYVKLSGFVDFMEYDVASQPGTPAGGLVRLYAHNWNQLVVKNDGGFTAPVGDILFHQVFN